MVNQMSKNINKNYIQKHKLINLIGLPLSEARAALRAKSIRHLQEKYPEAFQNFFLLKYPRAVLAQRIQPNAIIQVDSIRYQVVFINCTPTMLKEDSDIVFWASFRNFSSEYELPPTVVIYPSKELS